MGHDRLLLDCNTTVYAAVKAVIGHYFTEPLYSKRKLRMVNVLGLTSF